MMTAKNSGATVYVVSRLLDVDDGPAVLVFDNPLSAQACYDYFCRIHESAAAISLVEYPVYGSFMVGGGAEYGSV